MFPLLLFSLVALGAYQVWFFQRRRARSASSWGDMVSRIVPLDRSLLNKMSEVASSTHSSEEARHAVLASIGGLRALRDIERNAAAMLELAIYAEQWNEVHGPLFSALLRHDALQVGKQCRRIRLWWLTRCLSPRFVVDVTDVCRSYQCTRIRLLAIYETAHIGLLPQLQAIV